MIISMIVAMDEERGIGFRGKIPWHLSSDLKRFKQLTMSHHMIMGRKTYESIGKPLPGRTTIVISRKMLSLPKEVLLASSLNDALLISRERGEGEVFIIGGGEIFEQALSQTDRIYLTIIHGIFPKDVFFPELKAKMWKEIHREEILANEKDTLNSTFSILEKVSDFA